MDLRQLRYFLAVADRGSFTRAAVALHVSQPALSLAIGKLEDDLGTRLFERGDRYVRPTEAGERLIEHARGLLEAADRARQAVAPSAPAVHVLRLGAPALLASAWLPGALAAFVDRRPDVRLHVAVAGARSVEAQVAAGDLDLGLISEYQPSGRVEATALFEAVLGACLAEHHPLAGRTHMTWPEFIGLPLVLFPRGYYQRDLIEAQAARLRMPLQPAAETDAIPLLKAILRLGRAAGLLMPMAVSSGEGLTVIPFDKPARLNIAACRRKGESRDIVDALLTHLGDCAPDSANNAQSG